MITITLEMEQYDCPFIHATDSHDVTFSTIHWEADRTTGETEARVVAEGDDDGELAAGLRALRDHDGIREYDLLKKRGAHANVRTVVGPTTAMETIRDHDGFITGPFYVEDGLETWHVGFDSASVADDALVGLDRDNEFVVVDRQSTDLADLHGFVQNVGAAMTLIEGARDLSNTERRTLETAISRGYFENPRAADLGVLADEFDVSKPAVSKTLRRGEQKMIRRAIEALDDLE